MLKNQCCLYKNHTMKNPDQETIKDDEIPNIAQFQVDRSNGNAAEGHAPDEENDDESYTEDEIPFADGEGTQLDEVIDEQEGDEALADDELEDDELQGDELQGDELEDEELEDDELEEDDEPSQI